MQKNRETQFTVRCDVNLRQMAEELASKSGWSLAEFARRAIQEKCERELDTDPVSPARESEYIRREDVSALVEALVVEQLQKYAPQGSIHQTNSGDRANLSIKVGGRR